MKVSACRMLGCLAVAAGAFVVEGSRAFVAMLPNGGSVPDTPAIGHPDGTGDDASTNDFGDAFAKAGHKWTKELCEADTDGDGQTNGQELGDPCCEWDKDTNAVVQWTDGVSHPDDATKTSDESLWANIVCGSGSGVPELVSNKTSNSTGSTAASSSSGKSSVTTPTASTPSSSTSDASALSPIFMAVVGILATTAWNFV